MQDNTSQSPESPASHRVEETFKIEGMTCCGCVRRARALLETLPVQIKAVEIGHAVLAYDPTKIRREEIISAITEARNARLRRAQL